MTSIRRALAVVAFGFLAAAVIAVATGASAGDAARVIAFAAVGSGVAAAMGTLLVRRLRRFRMRAQVLFIALAATVTTVAGIVLAAAEMFISDHDVAVLAVVVVTSAAVSVGAALALGASFERSIEQVGLLARDLAPVDGVSSPVASTDVGELVTGELGELAAQLSEVSRQLDESRTRERALDASRRELIAGVSHDLRSPIASIRAMAEALEDGVVDDDASVERYHRAMRVESERLGALVDDLFELSRITAGVLDADQPFVPLGKLVADVVSAAQPAASTNGVRIVNLLDEVPSVLVPASDMRRILHNLLDNAIRHTRDGGTIVIDGEVLGQTARLGVTDECGGIPEADLARVFDVAFRGDAARTRDNGGGGLGLAIAKGLLEAHRGSIQIANRAPGCRFTLRLPVLPA
jgi:signal transduction histidine kinase